MRINFWVDATLAAMFLILQLSFITGTTLHQVVGGALGAGILIHHILHWRWIVAVGKSFFTPLPSAVRVNLLANAALLVFFSITLASGLVNSPMALSRTPSRHGAFMIHAIHHLSARLTFIAVVVHLVLHRKWIANALRRNMSWSFQTAAGQPR